MLESVIAMSVEKINFKGLGTPAAAGKMLMPGEMKLREVQQLRKELLTDLKSSMPKAITGIDWLNKKVKGEIPNIVINAVGTALVAPFFIRYNFLSKTDEDTRTYSALRQPLSAILAVITGVGMVIPFDRFLKKKSNEGMFVNPDLNLKFYQDEDYLKRKLTAEHPKMKPATIEKMVKETQLKQLDDFEKTFLNEGKIMVSRLDEKTGKVIIEPMESKRFRDLLVNTIDDMDTEMFSDINRYNGEKLQAQVKRGNFLRLYYKDELKPLLSRISDKAASLKNEKGAYKELTKFIKNEIKDVKKVDMGTEVKNELVNILTDIMHRPDVNTIKEHIGRFESKNKRFSNLKTLKEVEEVVIAHIDKDIKQAEQARKVFENLKTAVCENKPIKEIMKIAKQEPSMNFAYEVFQRHLKNSRGNIKAITAFTGLVVSLAILPVACDLLNRIYPKFMDFAFPNLSAKKKNKSNDRFVKSENSQSTPPTSKSEVKKGQEVDK